MSPAHFHANFTSEKESFAPPSKKKKNGPIQILMALMQNLDLWIHAMTIALLPKKKLYTKRYANFACEFLIHFGSVDSYLKRGHYSVLKEEVCMSGGFCFRIGDKVPLGKKGRYGVVKGEAETLFSPHHLFVESSNVEDFGDDRILQQVWFDYLMHDYRG